MSVLTELRDNTMVITINRPEAGNALNGDVGRGLVEAFDAALADDAVRCIILTGAGEKIFCAGMDLKAFAAGEDIRPVGQALAKLAAVGGSWRLDMYFGSWCVRCERYLPRIIATAHTQLAAQREWNSKVTTFELNFYGLPRRGRAFDADDEVKARRIREVPAGLIYKDGLLVGRIEGDDWDNPAAALYAVLSR